MQFDTRSLWIYLHFPKLQLDLIEATELAPESTRGLNERPSSQTIQNTTHTLPRAIVDVSSNTLCQLNNKALEQGLSLNMGLASASLTCSDLQLHEYSHEVESNHIVNIADHLYLVTSDIVLAAPSAIILRVQNMLALYGGLTPYWQVIKQVLTHQHVHFIAASSYSVQGAKVLALNHKSLISDDRKKIASNLDQCALSYTDIDPKDLQKLARIGVKTYVDMHALPVAELANRVSRFSMSIINELQGKQAARVTFYQPKARYHDYLELLYEISLTAKLLPVIGLSIDKLSEFLRLRNAHCLSIDMRFFQRDHAPHTYTFASIRPIYKTNDWLDIIRLKLESVKFESPVYALSLSCEQYEVAEVANDDMFAQKSTHLASLTLLSRLQSKLGHKGVNRLHFVGDFRPEHSTQACAIEAHSANSGKGEKSYKNSHSLNSIFADRPGLLLPAPEPLSLQVQVIKGPERIQTGWWDDKPINRDYYIGQSQDGQQVWIFRTPTQEWFLHGYFI
ncbi:MAG: protein ImuB [Alphaproteobacteria bacterium]|jgi:protein ImuB